MENPENWTSAKFREELQKLGINIPKTWSKSVLKQLYADNKERCASSPQVIGEDVQAAAENHILQDQQTTPAAANYENSSLTSSQGMRTNIQSGHGNDVNSQGPRMNIQPGPDVNTCMNLITSLTYHKYNLYIMSCSVDYTIDLNDGSILEMFASNK